MGVDGLEPPTSPTPRNRVALSLSYTPVGADCGTQAEPLEKIQSALLFDIAPFVTSPLQATVSDRIPRIRGLNWLRPLGLNQT